MTTSKNDLNFTKENIDALPLPAAGRATYHDTHKQAGGLQLRVTSKGTKTFCVFRRIRAGQPERITLGRYPEMTIDQARRQATIISAAIAEGVNPAAAKRAHKAELTFADLFGEYIERHAKPKKATWAEDEQRYRQYLQKPVGNKKLSAVDRKVVAQVHSNITLAGHPTVANRVLALISSVFGWAINVGLVEANPAKGIKRNKERSRDRFLQGDELPRFFKSLAQESNETMKDYFLLSLLTGARRANVLSMRWQDINFGRAEWRIEKTKNGEPQTVTLSPEALQILEQRKPEQAPTYVFPGDGKSGHLEEPKKGWMRILARAECIEIADRLMHAGKFDTASEAALQDSVSRPTAALEKLKEISRSHNINLDGASLGNLRIHDLRRTLGSWQAKTGASLATIGKSLNHKNIATTAIYARLDLDPVRDSVNTATRAMLAAGGLVTFPRVIDTCEPANDVCITQQK